MTLNIETFDNVRGGNAFFKAVGNPLVREAAAGMVARLAAAGPVALYDPLGCAGPLAELLDITPLALSGVFVQDLDTLDVPVLGRRPEPVTALPDAEAAAVFVAAFDARRLVDHIRHLAPAGATIVTLDEMRLPDDMLTRPGRYLDALNHVTNFAFFRDGEGHHTRLVSANYWAGYGAVDVALRLLLLDEDGEILADWRQGLGGAGEAVMIDSREVRERFGLGSFTGQLFLHVVNAAGHDTVKYALDTWGDGAEILSCTHDANAWPADFYAGLPAPRDDETVILWVQNSHPVPIPAGAIGMNLMGSDKVEWLQAPVPPFGTRALTTDTLLPAARWPQQIEIRAGRHFVRPRYEVVARGGRRRIAHANVERTDLVPDPRLAEAGNLLGKGYIVPAPVLPRKRFRSLVLPTPMATGQQTLPVALVVNGPGGEEVARYDFGVLRRADSVALDLDPVLDGAGLDGDGTGDDWGHMELIYDFAGGGEADGWLHGLFRYEDRLTGHVAETSFGAHIFNTALTWRGEPQSYAGPAPGLSTRLFLRLGLAPLDTICHLIYPASTPWHRRSTTRLALIGADGATVADRDVAIACGGSLLWRYSEMFDAAERARAGDGAWVQVRDTTCRLFGYHGLTNGDLAFSLDHMFGF